MNLNPRTNAIVSKIKKNGYSLTPQRLEIIKIIAESKNHPSAMDIYDKLKELYPMVSLNTVYKNLTMLVSLREVKEIKTLQDSVHYDGDMSMHGHAICEKCGKIMDVDIDELDFNNFFETKIKKKFDEDYLIINYGVEFYGLCSSCRIEEETDINNALNKIA